MARFTNETLSVTVPDGWLVEEHDDRSGLTLAKPAAALARYRQGGALRPGDRAFLISLTPTQLLHALKMVVEPSAAAAALAAALLAKLQGADGAEADQPEIVTLQDGREVALRKASTDSADGAVIVFEISGGVLALSTIAATRDEYESARESALAVLATLAFEGTIEALDAAIDPAPPF